MRTWPAVVLVSSLFGCAAHGGDRDQILNLVSQLYPTTPPPAANVATSKSDVWPCLLCLSDQAMQKIFSPKLAARLSGDEKMKDALGQCFGYGPLAEGQDYAIQEFRLVLTDVGTASANARVKFTNFGRPVDIPFEFQRSEGEWRVSSFGSIGAHLNRCQ